MNELTILDERQAPAEGRILTVCRQFTSRQGEVARKLVPDKQ
jgi:hypothetical protein